MAPLPAPTVLARALLVVWLVVGAVLALEDVPGPSAVASWLAPVRRGLGISQSWSMFAPNPPRATFWLEVEGRRGPHWELLPQPGSAPLSTPHRLRYERASKFTRGLVAEAAVRDRRHLALWWCRQDSGLKAVRFIHARLPSSPPGVAVGTGPIQRQPIGQHTCP